MTALLRCFRATLRQIAREREAFTVLVGATVIYGLFYPTPYLRQVLRKVPVVVEGWRWFTPIAGYATFIVPAVFILILQQTRLIGIGTLRVAERHTHTDAAEPIWAVLGGKVAALTLIYLVHAAYLFVVVFRIYGLPMRASPGAVVAVLVPFIAATTLLALVVAELF